MDNCDILDRRRSHRKAALQVREAGFDIVRLYATHDCAPAHFLNLGAYARPND